MASYPASGGIAWIEQGAAQGIVVAGYGSGAAQKPRSWLDHRHPDYLRDHAQWVYARDHYTGDLLLPDRLSYYLLRKALGESKEGYAERLRLADYTNHMATVIDSLIGMLMQIEDDANRVFEDDGGRGLGDPKEQTSPMAALWRDADGAGLGWLGVWRLLATELSVCRVAWVLVDTVDDLPRLRVWPATAVPNWRYDRNGILAEALLMEEADTRESMQDETGRESRFVHYTLAGWQRWKQDENGNAIRLDGPDASGTYVYRDQSRRSQLPLFRVELPLSRPVGYMLARKANAIFNQESARDHLLRMCNFPKLNICGSADTFDTVKATLIEGGNALHVPPGESPHHFISPPQEPAVALSEVLKRKVEEFYITAFREYGDTAAQRTATEVRQDTSAGVAAYLGLVRGALDGAENQALWRVEQTLWPTDAGRHFIAHVERSADFVPPDADLMIDKQNERVFGPATPAPVGFTAKLAAAKEAVEHQGFAVEEAEIAAAVRVRSMLDVMEKQPDLALPAEAKAELVVNAMLAAGLTVTPAIQAAARQLAEASDEAKRREAEPLMPATPTNGRPRAFRMVRDGTGRLERIQAEEA